MNTKHCLIIVIILLFFLTACGSSPNTTANFKTGYKGVVVTPIKNAPPKEIYSGSDIKLGIRLENLGAYEATNGKIQLSGFDKAYLSFFKTEETLETMEGRSAVNYIGSLDFKEFEGKVSLPEGIKEHLERFNIVTSYDYITELNYDACINPDMYGLTAGKDACKIKDTASFSGQGSPLAIEKVDEIIFPGNKPRVEFRLHLKNKDKGKITGLVIEEGRLGNQMILCSPMELDLEKGEDLVVCQAPLQNQDVYTTTLFVKAAFSYETTNWIELNIIGQKPFYK
ncbi:MAG TPA: hypothetical protein VJG31_01555 [Candidatus Nanoarchaeia archaeon]|nr:hypothetical protein [Candidatus Nanoarchaeia archaeon]